MTSSGNGDFFDQLKVFLKDEEIDDLKKQKVSMLEFKVYRKFSEISTALGISATIIHIQNNYWRNLPTPDSSKDTFHQKSATK